MITWTLRVYHELLELVTPIRYQYMLLHVHLKEGGALEKRNKVLLGISLQTRRSAGFPNPKPLTLNPKS